MISEATRIGAWLLVWLTLCFLCSGCESFAQDEAPAMRCDPTREDSLGPFYKPGAQMRSSVGHGYVLSGTVRSSEDCAVIPDACIEVWLAGPGGNYGDEFRAMLFSDARGRYRFESHVPPAYMGRPPHIHLKVSAQGFRPLVTQHYPREGELGANFDLVLKSLH